MYFKLVQCLAGGCFLVFPEVLHAASLSVSPDTCVTLNKGRECFTGVEIKWKAPQIGNYCLHQKGESIPLQCWQGQQQGRLDWDFVGQENTTLQLLAEDRLLAEHEIRVDWVYESRRPGGRWRLF